MVVRIMSIFLAVFLLLTPGVGAAQEDIPERITFDGSADGSGSESLYPAAYTGPVTFSHAKHVVSYGANCGDCHHDDSLEPIESYDPDKVYTCSDCHDEEGLTRGSIAENATSEGDLIAQRAHVLHLKCIGCHQRTNNEKRIIRAPEACIACHAKRLSGWVVK